MTVIYKIKHSLTPMHMQNMLCWRPDDSATPCVGQRGPMIVPYARTKYKQHTFKIVAPKLLNSLSTLCHVEFNFSIYMFKTGLRSRSRDRSWSRSESTVLPRVGVGAVVGKILLTPTPARSRKLPPVNIR